MGIRDSVHSVFKTRTARRWARATALLLIVIALAIIGINIYLKSMISSRLDQMVSRASHGLYAITYSGIRVNILSGKLRILDAALVADTSKFARLREARSAPRVMLEAKTARLSFGGVKWLAFLSSRKLRIGKLSLEKPLISLTRDKNQPSAPANEGTDYSKQLKELHIGLLSLENAVINYHAIDSNQERTSNTIENLNLDLSDISYSGIGTGEAELKADDYRIRIKAYSRASADSLYQIGFTDFDFSSKKRNGSLTSFYVKPRYPEKEFARKFKQQETRYDIKLNGITVEGVNFTSLFDKGQIIISKLHVKTGALHMFMDRSLPPAQSDDGEVVISKKIMKLFVPVGLEHLELENIDLSYGEHNPRTGQTAKFEFDQMNIAGHNLTNLPEAIARNKIFKVDAKARFLNADVKADFLFDLSSSEGSFTAKISANQIAADRLNPMLSAIAKIEARKGILKRLEASVTGNENQATANVNLLYEGLKVNILQKEGDTLRKKGLKSMFANMFVMDDNPKDGVLRTARGVRKLRPPGKSFFNMLWGSVGAGIQDIITDKKGFGVEPG